MPDLVVGRGVEYTQGGMKEQLQRPASPIIWSPTALIEARLSRLDRDRWSKRIMELNIIKTKYLFDLLHKRSHYRPEIELMIVVFVGVLHGHRLSGSVNMGERHVSIASVHVFPRDREDDGFNIT